MHPIDIKINDFLIVLPGEESGETRDLEFRPAGEVLFIDIKDDENDACIVLDYDDVLLLKNTLDLIIKSNLIIKRDDSEEEKPF